MDDLHGRIALVTGASRGIGRAIAIALANAGASVAINYKTRKNEANQTARQIATPSMTIQADVTKPADVRAMVVEVEQKFGAIHILVNNAGIARVQPPDQITEHDWDEILTANLKSSFLVTQAVLPMMRAQRYGRIIFLSSVAAHVGGVVGAHYAASKAGMLGLMHYYANSLVKEGITANAISPALIETEMVTANINATADRIPVGRFGRPEETAEIAVMLARNGYMTGQTIHVNGGWYHT